VGGQGEEEEEAMVPGLDVCGIVDQIGPDPTQDVTLGELVLYHGDMTQRHGGLADFAGAISTPF